MNKNKEENKATKVQYRDKKLKASFCFVFLGILTVPVICTLAVFLCSLQSNWRAFKKDYI